MKNEMMVALAKLVSKDMPEINAGKYKIDQVVTLRIKAEVSKGESYTVRASGSMPWLKLTKFLIKHSCGQDAQAAVELATEAVAYCLDTGNSEALDSLFSEIDEVIDKAVEDAFDKLPRVTRSGATKVSGEIEVLEVEAV